MKIEVVKIYKSRTISKEETGEGVYTPYQYEKEFGLKITLDNGKEFIVPAEPCQ